jgi:hypothetical protein
MELDFILFEVKNGRETTFLPFPRKGIVGEDAPVHFYSSLA